MHRIVFGFFFLSGFSSLVFEVLWERMLMQVFGATTFAISTLLTAFMAGLALGSFLGGRVAHRLKRPLLTYGLLEGCIGLYALLVPWMLGVLPGVYGALFDTFIDDFYLFSLLRFVAVFLILLLPTTLMGATLPIVSQWISRHERLFHGSIGLLYGCNTLGACAGCFAAGFLLLPRLGLFSTNLTFAIVNFALCAVVLLARRALSHETSAQQEAEASDGDDLRADDESLASLGLSVTLDPLSRRLQHLLLGVFALSGAISMGYQVLWTRAYVIVLGSSTYSFTLILVTFLVGLSGGSAVISLTLSRIKRPLWVLGMTQLGVALGAMISFFVLDHLPEVLFHRLRGNINSANEVYAYNFLLVGAVVLLPTFLQGMAFPLVVRTLVQVRGESGKRVGNLYAFNTMGSIFGSFIAGFGLLPWLGLSKSIAVVVALNLLGAALLLAGELSQHRTSRRLILATCALALAGATLIASPSIDKIKLTRGLFRTYWARELFDAKKLAKDAPELLFYEDGITVTTSIERRGKLITLKGNGKAEASDGADMATQILVGLTPFIFYSARERVPVGQEVSVMVGYGSGVTAGGSLQWPLKSLEVIEIEEAMLEASRFFDHVNHRPLQDERVEVIISDGRNYLEYNERLYDVIVSEPSNPWIAGVASLFTVEHFERARRHLKPGGMFGQWVQLYEMDPQNVRVIFATFAMAFDYVQVFSSMPKGTDLILIGSDEPIPMPADGFASAMEIESVRKELERAGIRDMYDFYGLMFMNHAEFLEFGKGAPLNTDDNGFLEFEAPKDLVRYERGQRFFSEQYHSKGSYGDPRPALEQWGDERAWTKERLGHLTRGIWQAGKFELAEEILEETGWGDMEQLPEPISAPLDPLERVLLANHARKLDLSQAVVHLWPDKQHDLYVTIMDSAMNKKTTQAMIYMESQERPDPDGYSGLKGLYYTYLLMERGYWRHALRQVQRLRREGDEVVTESVLFSLFDGAVHARRLRYKPAFNAYLKAGEKLL